MVERVPKTVMTTANVSELFSPVTIIRSYFEKSAPYNSGPIT